MNNIVKHIVEDFNFDEIKQNDETMFDGIYQKIFKKVFNHEQLSSYELSLFNANLIGYNYKFKVTDPQLLHDFIKRYNNHFPGRFYHVKKNFIDGLTDLNWIDVSEITDMSSMFFYVNKPFGISEWDVSNVVTMRDMFSESRIYGIDLSKWDVSNVEDFSYMFYRAEEYSAINDKNKKIDQNLS